MRYLLAFIIHLYVLSTYIYRCKHVYLSLYTISLVVCKIFYHSNKHVFKKLCFILNAPLVLVLSLQQQIKTWLSQLLRIQGVILADGQPANVTKLDEVSRHLFYLFINSPALLPVDSIIGRRSYNVHLSRRAQQSHVCEQYRRADHTPVNCFAMFRRLFGGCVTDDCSDAEEYRRNETNSQEHEPGQKTEAMGEYVTRQSFSQKRGSWRTRTWSSQRISSSTKRQEERQRKTSAANRAAERQRKRSSAKRDENRQRETLPVIIVTEFEAEPQRKTSVADKDGGPAQR